MTTNFCTESATVVTASTSDASFPVANLQHPFRSKRWRSTSPDEQRIVFDMQTAEPIDSVVLLWPKEDGIRLSNTAVIKIEANATNTWGSPAVSETLTIDNDYVLVSHYFSSDQEYRYWSVYIDDPGNPYDCVELGVVWLGKGLDLDNMQNGFKYSLAERSKVSSTDFGHEYVDEYPQSASIEFSYGYMDYTNIQTLENAYRTNGNRKPVFIVLDADDDVFDRNHFAIYGKFGNGFSSSHVMYDLLNVEGIVIQELS